ncbi:MAG TPA: ATPase, T2SS/T4P/T4SS family [Candidatus Saccharimonadales bacterium]|nr:ATPase, T2SS/T4P/T4SS family [Candidatus Saccharimonadales bacterium]
MNLLSPTSQARVEEVLVTDGLLSDSELSQLKNEALKQKKPVLAYIIQTGRISDEQLTKALAEIGGVPYVNLSNLHVDAKILGLLPKDLAVHYMAVPIGEMQNQLVVAMLDADNIQAVDFLSNKIGRPLKVYAASGSGVRHIIDQYGSAGLEHGVSLILDSAQESSRTSREEDTARSVEKAAQTIVQDSPISKALNAIMEYAAANKASDVHIESLENELKIRCRVDGVLREVMRLPKSAEAPIISRIKILSNLKIDEHRVPQDGQFTIKAAGREIDLRVAISPVIWGEQVVLRLLDKSDTSLKLEQMGYNGRGLRAIRQALTQPYGMILTSGPTGSGKTTSMYAMIQEIKNDAINIVTLEDPVEYKIPGINQIQVNPDVGLTFASGLRSILRQDPNVVMVGEIRDKETANLAVQAALTGHLVFSTLHTNTAAGILPRLLDMGVEPFLIASTVHTVIGQRLVRKVVPGGQVYSSSPAETKAIQTALGHLLPKTPAQVAAVGQDLGYANLPLANQNAYTLVKGKSSPDNQSGFAGRMGLYEVFQITEQIQDLILKRSTSAMIQQIAMAQGMVTMRQDGYLKALAGLTTLLEVNRVASVDA